MDPVQFCPSVSAVMKTCGALIMSSQAADVRPKKGPSPRDGGESISTYPRRE
jgi:hypothetical protein